VDTTVARRNRRAVGSLLALALALSALALAPASPAGASPGAESSFVSSINGLRAGRGLGSLSVDGSLVGVARAWATQMADAGRISHNPSLSSQVSLDWRRLGENVGVGPTVSGLHDAFVASPTHLANLVDASYTHVGVGVVERAGMLYTAHVFVAVAGVAPPPPPPPPPTATLPPPPAPPRGAPAPPAPAPSQPGGNQGQDEEYGGPVAPGAPDAPAAAAPPAPPAAPVPDPLTTFPAVLVELRALDEG